MAVRVGSTKNPSQLEPSAMTTNSVPVAITLRRNPQATFFTKSSLFPALDSWLLLSEGVPLGSYNQLKAAFLATELSEISELKQVK